jgi:hypothetical protein
MEPHVAHLADDSGALLNIMGVAMPGGRYRMLELRFASGVLILRCDDDTDELIAEVGRAGTEAVLIVDSWVDGLLGKRIEYAWDLRNHHGYLDGFQVRLVDDQHDEEARQFEVAAAGIDVRWIPPTRASA